MTRRPSGTTLLLITLFSGSGVLHFLRPAPFVAIVPKMLPHKEELVAISGAVELASAALLILPRTRRIGGLLSAGLLASVFPANVSMAMRSGKRPLWFRIAAWVRLPLQIPLIVWATKASSPPVLVWRSPTADSAEQLGGATQRSGSAE